MYLIDWILEGLCLQQVHIKTSTNSRKDNFTGTINIWKSAHTKVLESSEINSFPDSLIKCFRPQKTKETGPIPQLKALLQITFWQYWMLALRSPRIFHQIFEDCRLDWDDNHTYVLLSVTNYTLFWAGENLRVSFAFTKPCGS